MNKTSIWMSCLLIALLACTTLGLRVLPAKAQSSKCSVLTDSEDVVAYPCHIVASSPDTTYPHGLSPSVVKSAYNLPSTGGTGTIAIVDAYDDPTALNDLNVFSQNFSLPSPNFEKHMMTANITFNSGWAEEISLDVQWAHAIAPTAKILLVEATNSIVWYGNGTAGPLLEVVNYARNQSDVVAISMSWQSGSSSLETNYDSYFTSSFGAAFFSASGDAGENATWPAASPNVIGVGGTTLNFNANGTFSNETVWNGNGGTTGGGVSAYEPEPSFQSSYGIQGANSHRVVPDISYDADPVPGYPIYANYSGQTSWYVVGGTSAGPPQWSAIKSLGLLASNDRFYTIAETANYTSCFRDIIYGTNGNYNATLGYDFCTGLGSPLTTIFHYPPSIAVLSGPQTVARDVWYTYTTNAVNDPDGGQIRYHLNVTGPGTPYQNTTIWVNSGTVMTWKGMWEPTDNAGAWLFQTWVEDSYEMLSNMTSITVNLVDPVSAMKTNCSGFFYVPTVATGGSLKIEEFYTGDINGTGDQCGATSPYPSLGWWPDGKVDGKDVAKISTKFGLAEGNAGWEYMADVYPDRKIDGKDIAVPRMYFGDPGVYTSYLSNLGITVTFNGGTPITPDANGFVSIPQNATNFIVEQNSNPIGALITFWNTTVT